MSDLESLVQHEFVRHGDVRLHCVVAGAGPPVVLLHGFPDFWYTWRKQIPALVDAGFKVVAPDLRGYNLSDKPSGVGAYRLDELVADVIAIVRHAGPPATVIGHDWGGVIAWLVAAEHPGLIDRLVIANAPRVDRYKRALANPLQLARSWYVLFFQLPLLPEAFMRLVGTGPSKGLFGAATTGRDADVDSVSGRYQAAFSAVSSFRAPINYYRAAARRRRRAMDGTVEQPVLVLWGARDSALDRTLADPGPGAPNATTELIEDAGHWVHVQRANLFNERLLQWLASTKRSARADSGQELT